MIRSNVVLPDPLSPRMVRNSPSATSREISRNTTCLPNCLDTDRTLKREEFGVALDGTCMAVFMRNASLLRRLHFIPDFVVPGAAWDILPKVDTLLVFVHVVEMQVFLLLGAHKCRGVGIRWRVASHIGGFLLGLCLDHVLEKFVRQFFILA